SQFAFVLDALRELRENDGFIRPDNGRRRLEKKQWLLRRFVAELGNVLCVVSADANDLRWCDRRKNAYFVQLPHARARGPRLPGHSVNLADVLAFDLATKSWRIHGRVTANLEPAESH